jgi:phospholipase C
MNQIKHLVVLMLENRSFDHMLGYLRHAGMIVEGRIGQTNFNDDEPPSAVTGYHLTDTRVRASPRHDVAAVAKQINGGLMDGFVRAHGSRPHVADVMSYYDNRELRSYDMFARQYAVCDHWFASVPGPTWPNRFFAMCGTSAGITGNLELIEHPTFFDLLPAGSFRYYSHDVAFLRSVKHYTGHSGLPIAKISEFYRACEEDALPSVSWIDPNFTWVHVDALLNWANDDHPPADVARGQNLVTRIYNYLISRPGWMNTLFVVVYDEHGGFYDHVAPPMALAAEAPPFDRYGVRVPAFVISPWVPAGVPYQGILDHTCIARTALELFAPSRVNQLSPRVSASPSLLPLLSNTVARDDARRLDGVPILETAIAPIWRGATAPRGYHSMELTENQREIIELKNQARTAGVPDERH